MIYYLIRDVTTTQLQGGVVLTPIWPSQHLRVDPVLYLRVVVTRGPRFIQLEGETNAVEREVSVVKPFIEGLVTNNVAISHETAPCALL